MNRRADHWNTHALQWNLIGSPLRPAQEDIDSRQSVVQRWHSSDRFREPNAMLLGVTPENAQMRWPSRTRLVSMEHSEAMIRSVWPAAMPGHSAVCAAWLALPVRDVSHDIVVGDGGFNMLTSRDQSRALMREIRRVIRGHGIFMMRFFIRPEIAESVSGVVDDLMQERIGNFHIWKRFRRWNVLCPATQWAIDALP